MFIFLREIMPYFHFSNIDWIDLHFTSDPFCLKSLNRFSLIVLLMCICYLSGRWIQAEEKHCVCQLDRWRIWECWRHRVAGGENCTMYFLDQQLFCTTKPDCSSFILFVYPGLSFLSEHESLLLHQPGWSCNRY